MAGEFLIPESITVHRGPPGSETPNRIVPFLDYIKTVASCEIHPACSENAARALILAEISHALFRLETSWYRRMGYDYDITDLVAYDQLFLFGHVTYEPIDRLVYAVFPDYAQKGGLPCCRMSAAALCREKAAGGKLPKLYRTRLPVEDILKFWYGEDIGVVHRTLTSGQEKGGSRKRPPCRTDTLQKGNAGSDVRTLQIKLNCISHSFPAIPKINPVSGVFDEKTQDALLNFRKVFHLPDSETVGAAVICRLNTVYAGHKRLSGLESRRLITAGFSHGYPGVLRLNCSGPGVRLLQYILAVIGCYDFAIEMTKSAGGFDKMLENAVIAFQKEYGLAPDGIVGQVTWLELERACNGALEVTPLWEGAPFCPKETLRPNSVGDDVRRVQQWLNEFAAVYPNTSSVSVTGHYGSKTQQAVRVMQKEFGLSASGEVDEVTWEFLSGLSVDLKTGFNKRSGQFPGFSLEQSFRSFPNSTSRRMKSERRE